MSKGQSHKLFSLVQQPKSGVGYLFVEVSSSHTLKHTHIHMLWFLRTNGQVVAEAATYTTHNKHDRLVPMPSAGLEPTIAAIKWLQIYALGDTATGIGRTQD